MEKTAKIFALCRRGIFFILLSLTISAGYFIITSVIDATIAVR